MMRLDMIGGVGNGEGDITAPDPGRNLRRASKRVHHRVVHSLPRSRRGDPAPPACRFRYAKVTAVPEAETMSIELPTTS